MHVSRIALAVCAFSLIPISAHAKFVSPDPVGFADGGPEYFNRYAYAANDPINRRDPTGKCSTTADGGQVGVCPTDFASGVVLEVTKLFSPETRQADSLAESQGVKVPFRFKSDFTGGRVFSTPGPDGSVSAQSVVVGGQSIPIEVTDLNAGDTVSYTNGPFEITAHEVGGHVLDNLTGAPREGTDKFGNPQSEVNAMGAENTLRQNLGVPIQREIYTGFPQGEPSSIVDYLPEQ